MYLQYIFQKKNSVKTESRSLVRLRWKNLARLLPLHAARPTTTETWPFWLQSEMGKLGKSKQQVPSYRKEADKPSDGGRSPLKYKNKEKVLVVSSRGITFRCGSASPCESRDVFSKQS